MTPMPQIQVKTRNKPGPKPEEPPVVIQARKRHYQKIKEIAHHPAIGGQDGAVIFLVCKDVFPKDWKEQGEGLWAVWAYMCRAHATYRRRILDQKPTGPKTMFVHETIEAEADAPDDRTEDEKDADARDAWRFWRARLDDMPPTLARFAAAVRDGVTTNLINEDGEHTRAGRTFVMALRELKEVYDQHQERKKKSL